MDHPENPFAAQVEQADRAYVAIPSFGQFKGLKIDHLGWGGGQGELSRARESTGEHEYAAALAIVLRAAATESGAIEQLYDMPPGMTITVAQAADDWQAYVNKNAPGALPHIEAQLATYALLGESAKSNLDLSEAWIRSLQERITAGQATYDVLTNIGFQTHALPKGQYKRFFEVEGERHDFVSSQVPG